MSNHQPTYLTLLERVLGREKVIPSTERSVEEIEDALKNHLSTAQAFVERTGFVPSASAVLFTEEQIKDGFEVKTLFLVTEEPLPMQAPEAYEDGYAYYSCRGSFLYRRGQKQAQAVRPDIPWVKGAETVTVPCPRAEEIHRLYALKCMVDAEVENLQYIEKHHYKYPVGVFPDFKKALYRIEEVGMVLGAEISELSFQASKEAIGQLLDSKKGAGLVESQRFMQAIRF